MPERRESNQCGTGQVSPQETHIMPRLILVVGDLELPERDTMSSPE